MCSVNFFILVSHLKFAEIKRSVETNGKTHKIFYIYEYIVDHMIGTMKVPFVSLINGITMGAGCGISVNGRFRVATEKAVLATPEVGIGLFRDAGATFSLPRWECLSH
jgi:enoyl-CoA hydratase/carnithine racemase